MQEIETYSNLDKYDSTYIKSIEDSSIIDKYYGTRTKTQKLEFSFNDRNIRQAINLSIDMLKSKSLGYVPVSELKLSQ